MSETELIARLLFTDGIHLKRVDGCIGALHAGDITELEFDEEMKEDCVLYRSEIGRLLSNYRRQLAAAEESDD